MQRFSSIQCPLKEKQVLLGLLTGSWFGQKEKGTGDKPGRDESGKSSRASGSSRGEGSCGGLKQACRWSLELNLGMHRGGNCRHRHV